MAAVAAQAPTGEQVDLSTIPVSPEGASNSNENTKPVAEGDQITVFHDKDNFNVKHPLTNKWTLWFTKPPSGKVVFFYHESFLHQPC